MPANIDALDTEVDTHLCEKVRKHHPSVEGCVDPYLPAHFRRGVRPINVEARRDSLLERAGACALVRQRRSVRDRP